MSDDDRQDRKLDDLLNHVLEIKVTLAEFKGERLPDRVHELEKAVHENDRKWARLAGMSSAVGLLTGGFLGALGKKLGLTP